MQKIFTNWKKLAFLLLLAFKAINSFGQVTLSSDPTVISVSADKVGDFMNIKNIVIQGTQPNDFGTTEGTYFIRLNAPDGWEFNSSKSVGYLKSGDNIDFVRTETIDSKFLLIKYSYKPSTVANNIRILNLEVKSTSGAVKPDAYITRGDAGSGYTNATINGFGIGDKIGPILRKTPGAFKQLQVLLPGETPAPGLANGKTGTANQQTAGAIIPVTVNAVDAAFNVVTTAAGEVSISANVIGSMPPKAGLVNGTQTFNVILTQAGTGAMVSAAINNTSIPTATGGPVTINPAPYSKLQILVPGETAAPGSASGKTGTPNLFKAKKEEQVTVRTVDQYWNVVSIAKTINISVTGATNYILNPNTTTVAMPVSGTYNFDVTFNVVGQTPTITVTDEASQGITASVSVSVTTGDYAKLLILLPGETIAPNTPTGKTGTVTGVEAGTQIAGRVYAVDEDWNIVTTVNNQINITCSSKDAIISSPITLIDGQAAFAATITEAATHTLEATDPAKSFTAGSSVITVTPGAYKKLLILLPGETPVPGSATGKIGTATDRVSEEGFLIDVYAVDQYWNKVSAGPDIIKITSNDPAATLPPSSALTEGHKQFRISLITVGSTTTITATDETDASKTPYTTGNINVKSNYRVSLLVIVLPGESYDKEGSVGKSGTPDPIKAGLPITIKVYLLNDSGDIFTSSNLRIRLSDDTDLNAVINPLTAVSASGVATFTVTFKRVGTLHQLTAEDLTSGDPANGNSGDFEVLAGTYTKILALLPGQTQNPGSATGVNGTIVIPGRGQPMSIKLIAVDDNFNTVSDVTGTINRTSLSDLNAKNLPETATFLNGELTFSDVIFETPGSQSVTYKDLAKNISVTINIADPSIKSKLTDYFRSAAVGKWDAVSSWESATDGVTWMQATLPPTDAAAKITINGHVIEITTDVRVKSVAVENGGTVDVRQGTLTIASGGSFTVNNGTLKNAANIVTTGILEIESAGKYEHAFTTDAGVIPTATWKEGSVCEVAGYTTFAANIKGTDQAFYNFNWNAPNQTANVSINADFNVKNLTIASTGGGGVIFNNNNTSISGNFTLNGGNIDFTQTQLNFNGATDQSISNNKDAPLRFKKVKFSGIGIKTLTGTGKGFYLNADGVLTLIKNVTLEANGKLTLLSEQNSTAAIATIPNGSKINGAVTVNRFITGGSVKPYRMWRMISSPTNKGGNYSLADVIDDVIVTGYGGKKNGFDETSQNSPSAAIYDNTGNGFVAISSVDQKIPIGTGIFLFFRGNRNNIPKKTIAPYSDPENTIINFTGNLNQGDINVPLTGKAEPPTASFNLVGNPYASAINMNTLYGDNASFSNSFVRIWSPKSNSYQTKNLESDDLIISSGQSFFVQFIGGGTLTFKENCKILSTQSASPFLFKPENSLSDLPLKQASGGDNQKKLKSGRNNLTAMPRVKIQLKKPSSYNMDETCIAFDSSGSSKYLIAEDAYYLPAEEIKLASLSSDNVNLAYNIMEEIGAEKIVKLDVNAIKSDDYSLTFNLSNIPQGVKIWLMDKYLNTQTPVSNGQTVNFAIDKSVPASFGAERFSIVFNQEPTLESVITDFKGKKVNEGVMLSWAAKAGADGDYFQIQRAGSDNIYSPLTSTVKVKNELSSYVLLDSKPLTGNNYYQLSMVDKDGKKTTYSKVVSIYYDGISKAGFTVYPNPAGEKTTVKYEGVSGDKNMIKVANITGQFIYGKSVNESELQNGFEINLGRWAPGVYLVELIDKTSNKRIDIQKLIKK